jgi:hypothetical protein
MIFLPAFRFLTGPFPPGASAARFFAAVILPPLLFFAIFLIHLSFTCNYVSACEEPVQYDDHSDYQQYVNKTSPDSADEPEQPEYHEDYGYSPE